MRKRTMERNLAKFVESVEWIDDETNLNASQKRATDAIGEQVSGASTATSDASAVKRRRGERASQPYSLPFVDDADSVGCGDRVACVIHDGYGNLWNLAWRVRADPRFYTRSFLVRYFYFLLSYFPMMREHITREAELQSVPGADPALSRPSDGSNILKQRSVEFAEKAEAWQQQCGYLTKKRVNVSGGIHPNIPGSLKLAAICEEKYGMSLEERVTKADRELCAPPWAVAWCEGIRALRLSSDEDALDLRVFRQLGGAGNALGIDLAELHPCADTFVLDEELVSLSEQEQRLREGILCGFTEHISTSLYTHARRALDARQAFLCNEGVLKRVDGNVVAAVPAPAHRQSGFSTAAGDPVELNHIFSHFVRASDTLKPIMSGFVVATEYSDGSYVVQEGRKRTKKSDSKESGTKDSGKDVSSRDSVHASLGGSNAPTTAKGASPTPAGANGDSFSGPVMGEDGNVYVQPIPVSATRGRTSLATSKPVAYYVCVELRDAPRDIKTGGDGALCGDGSIYDRGALHQLASKKMSLSELFSSQEEAVLRSRLFSGRAKVSGDRGVGDASDELWKALGKTEKDEAILKKWSPVAQLQAVKGELFKLNPQLFVRLAFFQPIIGEDFLSIVPAVTNGLQSSSVNGSSSSSDSRHTSSSSSDAGGRASSSSRGRSSGRKLKYPVVPQRRIRAMVDAGRLVLAPPFFRTRVFGGATAYPPSEDITFSESSRIFRVSADDIVPMSVGIPDQWCEKTEIAAGRPAVVLVQELSPLFAPAIIIDTPSQVR